jgi:N-acetylglucosaminyldiphosphoundecaprenol N-acetyl-beta-D-mannosaminyltransferase
MMFLGALENTLQALKERLSAIDERIASMPFVSLPFLDVSKFNYPEIAQEIKQQDPDLIFISLGMPKQEFFMHKLYPYLDKGILIGVGAAFKFHSGLSNQKRAPRWMIRSKMEWIHRILSEPKKQIKRCSLIASTMPFIFIKEYKKKKGCHLISSSPHCSVSASVFF